MRYFKYSDCEDAYIREKQRELDAKLARQYEKMQKCSEDYVRAANNRIYDNMIDDVVFNKNATIVFWADGTKTIVKCQPGDKYDPEKGLLACMAKKLYGGNGFNRALAKWCPQD